MLSFPALWLFKTWNKQNKNETSQFYGLQYRVEADTTPGNPRQLGNPQQQPGRWDIAK